jgi:hypothetical protein
MNNIDLEVKRRQGFPASILCKFSCSSVEEFQGGSKKVKMSAVYDNGKGDNKDFCDATPSGNFDMIINAGYPAGSFCKPGKKYYFLIIEADED